MVWPLIIGAAMVVGGAISQATGNSSRERARARAMRNIRRENTRFADARLERHTALADAMARISTDSHMSQDEFWDERNAPARAQASQEAQTKFDLAARAGAERGTAGVPAPVEGNAFAKAMRGRELELAPITDAEFELIGAQGAQLGREGYDQSANDRLALALASLDMQRTDTLLPFEVGSQERAQEHARIMDRLGQRYDRAGQAGSGALLAGSLLQLGGDAMMNYGFSSMQSPQASTTDNLAKNPPDKSALAATAQAAQASQAAWQNRGRQ